STTFTVSVKGITEIEAAGIHKVCTINRLSRLRRRHSRILGSKLKRFRDEHFHTNADSRSKTVSKMLASPLRSECADQVMRIHRNAALLHMQFRTNYIIGTHESSFWRARSRQGGGQD